MKHRQRNFFIISIVNIIIKIVITNQLSPILSLPISTVITNFILSYRFYQFHTFTSQHNLLPPFPICTCVFLLSKIFLVHPSISLPSVHSHYLLQWILSMSLNVVTKPINVTYKRFPFLPIFHTYTVYCIYSLNENTGTIKSCNCSKPVLPSF